MQGESVGPAQPAGTSPGVSMPAGPIGFEQSWQRFQTRAASVEARDVVVFNHNTSVVLHNVTRGATAVLNERPWFEAQAATGLRVDFGLVADAIVAAEALEFTSARAQVQARPPAGVVGRIRRGRAVLEILRGSAELMVMAGYLKPAEVPVGADNGPRGVARACLRFVSFYRANWSRVRGLSPVDRALLEEAAQLGAALLREVKPRGVGKGSARTEEARAASDDRDRMAVVVTRLYDYVERVGAWRWGRDCEAQVPSMLSRDTSRGGADDEDVVEEDDDAEEETAADEEGKADGADDAEDDAARAEDAAEGDADDAAAEDDADDAPPAPKPAPKKTAARKAAAAKPGVKRAAPKPAPKKTAAGR